MTGESTLRKWRKKRSWTQDQLAVLSGVDQTTISRLETEPSPRPTDDTRDKLAKALGIAPSKLQFTAPEPSASVDDGRDRSGHTKRKAS